MTFSMPSFFVGVGTVVGAIALGFGGGVILTGSAVRDTSTPARVERVAHPESVPSPKGAVKVEAAKIQASLVPAPQINADPPVPPVAESTQAVVPLRPQATQVPAQTADVARAPEALSDQVGPADRVRRDDQEKSARQQRAERRAERRRIYAEQKARTLAVARMRQPQFEERQPARPELAFEREDVGFSFFGRSNEPLRTERD